MEGAKRASPHLDSEMPAAEYQYDLGEPYNDPYDRTSPIKLAVQELMDSRAFMGFIRQCPVPPDSLAVWYLGQTGILKDPIGLVIAIDLTFRLDRQLPVLIEPEDWDVDIFIATHSHDDPADPETIRGLDKNRKIEFVGSFDTVQIYRRCRVSASATQLLHPEESVTDLNHTGVLISFSNNLSAMQAAAIVKAIRPKVVVPRHYDMINNVGSPQMSRIALDVQFGSRISSFQISRIFPRR